MPFAVPFTSTLNRQYVVFLRSTALPGSGWAIALPDNNDNRIASGTTQAQLDGATIGGTTDQWVWDNPGDLTPRHDIPVALVQQPAAPGGLAATSVAAA